MPAARRSGLRTATTQVVTEINRTAVLDAVRKGGPMSRRQIGEQTGLSSATVERLSASLLSDGALVVDGWLKSSTGRPSALLRYSGASQYVIAAEVSARTVTAVLVDLDGREVARERADVGDEGRGPVRLEELLHAVDRLLLAASAAGRPCTAIGVSVPGVVHDGRVMNTAELEWRGVPLGRILESRTGVTTFVENDANAIAFGESVVGAGAGARAVVALVLGVGLGSGFVLDGRIHHGAHSAAGEIGYVLADRGALERWFTDEGDLEGRIAESAGRAAPPGTQRGAAALSVIRTAGASGAAVEGAAAEFFDLVAVAIASIATVLDPDVIVLAGHLANTPARAVEELGRRLVGRLPFPPVLRLGSLGPEPALTGVRELVTRAARSGTYLS